MRRMATIASLLLISSSIGHGDEISVAVQVTSDWTPVGVVDPAPGAPAPIVAGALRRTRMALMPDGSRPVLPASADMHRSLRLEKTEYLLGEPILVELRVEVHGDGVHDEAIGGNYRARGRDDNVLVLMRHEDGTWADDPYGEIWGYMGGIGTTIEVSRDEPFSSWIGVSRRCVVERPGTWDVFLFHRTNDYEAVGMHEALIASLPEEYRGFEINDRYEIVDPATSGSTGDRVAPSWHIDHEVDSPLIAAIPDDVLEHAAPYAVSECSTYAHWRITVREGTPNERAAMILHWTQIVGSGGNSVMPARREHAAIEAVKFARGDDFLPLLREWMTRDDDYDTRYALGMNPHPDALALLLEFGPASIDSMYYLHESHREAVAVKLREWMASGDREFRDRAEALLRQWSEDE